MKNRLGQIISRHNFTQKCCKLLRSYVEMVVISTPLEKNEILNVAEMLLRKEHKAEFASFYKKLKLYIDVLVSLHLAGQEVEGIKV